MKAYHASILCVSAGNVAACGADLTPRSQTDKLPDSMKHQTGKILLNKLLDMATGGRK